MSRIRDILDEFRSGRRSLLRFKRYAKRDGDWLIDGRPWKDGERFHISTIDGWLRDWKWLIKECDKRIREGDQAFMQALDIAKTAERLAAQDNLAVYAPAINARHRQRIAMQKKNEAKALNQEERSKCEKLREKYWQDRKKPVERGAKTEMLRHVAKTSGLKFRRVRAYLDALPLPHSNRES